MPFNVKYYSSEFWLKKITVEKMPSPLQSIYRELQKPSLPENRETWIKDTHFLPKKTIEMSEASWIQGEWNYAPDKDSFHLDGSDFF